MRHGLWGAAAAAALMLAGCAGQPEIPFDKSTAGDIHTIGLLTPDMPETPSVRLASDIGQSFGLIGALVDASMEEARNKKLITILGDAKFAPRDVFQQDMLASLQSHGFNAVPVSADRSKSGFLKTYPDAAATKVDAYLDLTFIGIGYGYMAAGIAEGTPYRPFAVVSCKLVRASNGSVLMQDIVYYDPVNVTGKVVTISPDPAYAFATMDALEANPKAVVEGEGAAFHQTTDTIAGLLH